MAITFTSVGGGTSPDLTSSADASSYATGSAWTPAAGLTLFVVDAVSSTGTATTPTLSGNSLTWVQIGSTYDFNSGHGISLFAADGAGATSGVTTANFGGVTQRRCTFCVSRVNGADLSGGIAAAFVQQVPATGTGTTGTVNLSAASNANNRPFAIFVHLATEATTHRTNWTELDDRDGVVPANAVQTQCRTDAFETTASATWTTSTVWGAMALEIKAAVTTVLGAAAMTLDAITLTATGTVAVQGAASITLGAVTLSAAGLLPPPAPTTLVATPVTASRIDLSWTYEGQTIDGFEVERSPNGSTGWTVLDTLDAAARSYTDAGLASNTHYWYRVRGFRSS